ncbi:MAG TPA: NAD(P)/FAD-dependent oxidoreductase [Steroidobacteraceae bacterium]|jgi:kynurenine 3-monooxygenase|nr:NAD(P)/FAD-dependent oxidoreductase [Steroidobacteraceae bacterium]
MIRIVGAGPTGALLALLLERRGKEVELYEARPDPRLVPADSGRSINLALADRGIHALKAAGVFDRLGSALLPMRGRLIHYENRDTNFQPYGQAGEVIYSVSRHRLNQVLIEVAAQRTGVRLFFQHRFEAADFAAGTASIRDLHKHRLISVPMQPLLAADGAGSAMRREMAAQKLIQATETDLEHGYKELSMPPGPDRSCRIAKDVLHIWPRGNFMLIALPNDDGSFTATLFLPKHGPVSFAALSDAGSADEFLSRHFPDARELMPNAVAEWHAHPVGFLGTVSTSPWHVRGEAMLIGDAAHAMVPFHGQGMNCCFEDCMEFDAWAALQPWEAVFTQFSAARKRNTDAIAAMALDNYSEMRESVADPKFQLQRALSLELERRFPQRFIPRYSMVMFHHEIPYLTAQQRGAVQAGILTELTCGAVNALSDIDFDCAERLVIGGLPPL